MTVKIKRVYDPPSRDDGTRVLVDRLWPRGLKKDGANIDAWLKEAGPSTELRKWFNHDPARWTEFRRRFFAELDTRSDAVNEIAGIARRGTVTLLFGSREERFNNAVALKEYLEAGMNAHKKKKAA